MRAMRRWVIACVLIGCGGGTPATSATPAPSESHESASDESESASERPAPVGAAYEIHEWGVIDVPESGAVEISAGAGQPQRPISVRKPVLYVHLLDGTPEITFGLRVTLGAGSFVEHDPAGTITGTTLEWPQVVAHAAHCAPGGTSARETTRRGPVACTTPDMICEVDELPRYDAPSAACLDVGGAQTGLLFYRGQAPSVPLPVSTSRAADLTLTVNSTGPISGGRLLRLSTALSGPWPVGRIVIGRATAGATGSVTMPVGTEELTRAQGLAELRAILVEGGLADDEATAFLAGWADELFGADATAQRDLPARGYAGASVGPRHQDVLLYFLTDGAVDGIATLTPTPAPRATRRVFMVRIDLGGVATG